METLFKRVNVLPGSPFIVTTSLAGKHSIVNLRKLRGLR